MDFSLSGHRNLANRPAISGNVIAPFTAALSIHISRPSCVECGFRYKLAGSWSYEGFREYDMAQYLQIHGPFAEEVKVRRLAGCCRLQQLLWDLGYAGDL